MTLLSIGVNDIGLKSDWMLFGGLTLGTGTVLDSFHILGCTPCLTAALAIDAKGSARMWENHGISRQVIRLDLQP